MPKIALIFILSLCCFIVPLAAQDTPPDTGWPVEERCVGDPVSPPAGWTWDGTIFVQGRQGIRALNDYYQTPYFALFNDAFIYGAALSPDGRWYAVPIGEQRYATMIDYAFVVQGIKVISTDTSRQEYYVPWHLYTRGSSGMYAVPELFWLDNERLIYPAGYSPDAQPNVINPFTGETEEWEDTLSPMNALISPDGTQALQVNFNVSSSEVEWLLASYPDGELMKLLASGRFPMGDLMTWQPDSSGFFAVPLTRDDSGTLKSWELIRFDRDGLPVETVFAAADQNDPNEAAFSPSGEFLAVISYRQPEQVRELVILDVQNQTAIRPCITLPGYQPLFKTLVWSPTADQLAFRYQDRIAVWDVGTGEFYAISDIPGDVVAWGAAD